MKQAFMDLLYTNLILKNDFMPVKDHEGRIPLRNDIRILEKHIFGTSQIVEIVDTDLLDERNLDEKLKFNRKILSDYAGKETVYYYEIFLFTTVPEINKIEMIKSAQYQSEYGQKYLKCFTIDLSQKQVLKYFDRPHSSNGLEKTINATLLTNAERALTFEEMSRFIMDKERQMTIRYKAKKPVFTYIFISINIAVWVLLNILAMTKGWHLDQYGVKDNIKIMDGEYWRFVTPIFLHANLVHLVVNCYSLYAIGVLVERIFGHTKFLFIYMIAGIAGNIASFMLSIHQAVGASGAIFGLLGAMLYFGIENPGMFKRTFGMNIIVTIAINLVYGFSTPGIDNFAHLGGLAGGLLAGGIVQVSGINSRLLNRYMIAVLTIVLMGASIYYGFTNSQNRTLYQLENAQKAVQEEKWPDAENLAENALGIGNVRLDMIKQSLFIAAQSEVAQGKYDEAVEHSKQMISLDPATGHYILGICYYNMGKYDLSKQELLEAKRQNAKFSNIDAILDSLEKGGLGQ